MSKALSTELQTEVDPQLEQLDPVPDNGWSVVNARREPRYILLGNVEITVQRPLTRVIKGELCDVSNHGFRASYVGDLISTGSEVTFEHTVFRGRARVVWSRHVPEGNQSGFYILRD